MPTPAPGLKRVPRWRTMISPPFTACPANVLTPRRWALESRPLRLEPSPFLCAICGFLLACFRFRRCAGFRFRRARFRFRGCARLRRRRCVSRFGAHWFRGRFRGRFAAIRRDLGDLDLGELLAVAVAAFVAALGLELED